MLKPRIFYSSEVDSLILESYYDPKNQYFFIDGYSEYRFSKADSTWNEYSFVSVTTREDGSYTINGLLHASIGRAPRYVSSLQIMRFNDSIVFEKDLISFFDLMLIEHKFDKVSFVVAVGNPAEAFYDRFITKYGGAIVGIRKRHGQLPNGTIVDFKMYEIFSDDYSTHRGRKHHVKHPVNVV